MKLLIDNALSPQVAQSLLRSGFDVVHVREVSLAAASDQQIVDYAIHEERVIVSADTDFGSILATQNAAKPSYIFLRKARNVRSLQVGELLAKILLEYEQELLSGAVLVVTDARIRIRALPIGTE